MSNHDWIQLGDQGERVRMCRHCGRRVARTDTPDGPATVTHEGDDSCRKFNSI